MQGYELICVGNAIVDIIANVEDKLLLKLNLIKVSMKIVNDQEINLPIEFAINGNFPTLYLIFSFLSCFSVLPTVATSGDV